MIPKARIDQDIAKWLHEDVPFWDQSSIIFSNTSDLVTAGIVAKDDGCLAGMDVLRRIFEMNGVEILSSKSDGESIAKGDTVIRLEGRPQSILLAERTALNILSHMSGIATKVHKMTDQIKEKEYIATIAATRKTLPGLRLYQKWAVQIGGGDTHRLSLSSMVLIKENHIRSYDSMEALLKMVKMKLSFSIKIEIEVINIDEAKEAARLGVDIIMLDNFAMEKIQETVDIIREIDPSILVEVSGNISEHNFLEYASKGVDIISMGSLTHSVKAFDFSLLVD